MMDFMFFCKTLLLTVALVVLMQIEVGKRTIEAHALGWVQSSMLVAPLNEVAHGAGQFVRDVTRQLSKSVRLNVFKSKKEKPPAPGPKPEVDDEVE